jgi:hypothetical protein
MRRRCVRRAGGRSSASTGWCGTSYGRASLSLGVFVRLRPPSESAPAVLRTQRRRE